MGWLKIDYLFWFWDTKGTYWDAIGLLLGESSLISFLALLSCGCRFLLAPVRVVRCFQFLCTMQARLSPIHLCEACMHEQQHNVFVMCLCTTDYSITVQLTAIYIHTSSKGEMFSYTSCLRLIYDKDVNSNFLLLAKLLRLS